MDIGNLKELLFLFVLKLTQKASFGCDKDIESGWWLVLGSSMWSPIILVI